MKHYLSLCTMHRNEESYLPEWIAYHLSVGVEHFYIYDNNSTVPTAAALEPFIRLGLVTVTPIALFPALLAGYDHCLHTFGPETRWLGFVDCDEFIVPKRDRFGDCFDLRLILQEYEDHGGIAVNWKEFGSSGRRTRPSGLQLEAFTRCRPTDIVKSIVQPARVRRTAQSHYFEYLPGHRAVNERYEPVPCGRNPAWALEEVPEHRTDDELHATLRKLQVNHYFTRSEAEWLEKCRRGAHDGGRIDKPLTLEHFHEHNRHYHEHDPEILRHARSTRILLDYCLRGVKADHPVIDRLDRQAPHLGWTLQPTDQCVVGRFTHDGPGLELALTSARSLALIEPGPDGCRVRGRQDLWAGGWGMLEGNRTLTGDFDGDGLDELLVRARYSMGVLKAYGAHFRSIALAHDDFDGWLPEAHDWEVAADLDGDGAQEIYLRSPHWAGLLKLEEGRLHARSIQSGSIDGWALGPQDRGVPGRFRSASRQDILLRSPHWLGLLSWDDGAGRLVARGVQGDAVHGWLLGPQDQEVVGDFDGDGLDELFVRSPRWAGMLRWTGQRFHTPWMGERWLEAGRDGSAGRLEMREGDQVHKAWIDGIDGSGRDVVLHRGAEGLALLGWERGGMRVWAQLSYRRCSGWPRQPGFQLLPLTRPSSGPAQGSSPLLPAGSPPIAEGRQPLAFLISRDGVARLELVNARNEPLRLELRWLSGSELLFLASERR